MGMYACKVNTRLSCLVQYAVSHGGIFHVTRIKCFKSTRRTLTSIVSSDTIVVTSLKFVLWDQQKWFDQIGLTKQARQPLSFVLKKNNKTLSRLSLTVHANYFAIFISLATENAKLAKESSQNRHLCSGCKMPITDRYLLEALGMYWHEGCLKCNCCECKLGDIGSTLYNKANLILCKRDYLRSVKIALLLSIFDDLLVVPEGVVFILLKRDLMFSFETVWRTNHRQS